jgi:hypothetical protein
VWACVCVGGGGVSCGLGGDEVGGLGVVGDSEGETMSAVQCVYATNHANCACVYALVSHMLVVRCHVAAARCRLPPTAACCARLTSAP